MEKLVGYIKVPLYLAEDGTLYMKDLTNNRIIPVEEEED